MPTHADVTTMAAMDESRLLRNAKRLKARLIDTSTVLELFHGAQERERALEQ